MFNFYRKNSSNSFAQQQPLLDFDNDVDSFTSKMNNNAIGGSSMQGSDQPVLDQVIDLNNEPIDSMIVTKNNHNNINPADNTNECIEENSVIGAPIIAFEDSITASTKSDVPSTAGT